MVTAGRGGPPVGDGTRDALFKAFAMDDFAAHSAFATRRLEPGESVDVFLASLRRYDALFGDATNRQLAATFVNGMPTFVADTIRAGTPSERLSLEGTIARAREAMPAPSPPPASWRTLTAASWRTWTAASWRTRDGCGLSRRRRCACTWPNWTQLSTA